MALAKSHLAWLQAQVVQAQELAATSKAFGVFGTSISGTWLHGVLGDRVEFFVDEDPGRIGRTHMGRPVLASGDIPQDADVFVPLVPEVANAVVSRLATGAVQYHKPIGVALNEMLGAAQA